MAEQLKEHIKDPGSAITHFIGMLMAIFAAIPLLLKAAREPSKIYIIAIAVYAASLILLYAASTTYHTFDKSKKVNTILKKIDHMMISVLIAGSYTPICLLVLGGRTGIILLSIVWSFGSERTHWHPFMRTGMGCCYLWHPDQSILGILSEMGFIRALYRHGLDLRPGIYTIAEFLKSGGFRMAAGRWYHLHRWRCDLCVEASDL